MVERSSSMKNRIVTIVSVIFWQSYALAAVEIQSWKNGIFHWQQR